MSRIELSDTMMDVFMKLSEGNPGAAVALTTIHKAVPEVDPDSVDPVITLLLFDTFEIYGPNIWVLWKDVCNQEPVKIIMLIRATQLGLMTQDRLQELSQDRPTMVPLSAEEMNSLHEQVCERLPNFAKPETVNG